METNRLIVAVLAAMAIFAGVRAADKAPSENNGKAEMKAYRGSAEFERIKSLAGKWRGKMDEMKMDLEYTVVAGGSAVMERIFGGTPMEMVTVYYDQGGKLSMTHYCMLHNRPHLIMTESDEKSISLTLDEEGEVDASKDSHMHSLLLTFVSDNEIEQLWTRYVDGKAQEPHAMRFKRVKRDKSPIEENPRKVKRKL